LIFNYILPLLGLSFVVGFHEFGHLFAAKFFGIHVETFSIGIGKKIFVKTINNTDYAISLLPFGGYCKLKGGDINNIDNSHDSMDMLNPLKKIVIYFAGPFFNLILTFLLFTFTFLLPINQKIDPIIIPVLGKNLPAENSGLIKGDKILSINGNLVDDFNEISQYIHTDIIELKVERDNSLLYLNIYPQKNDDNFILGVFPYIPLIVEVDKGNNFIKGDKIIKINDIIVDNLLELDQGIYNSDTLIITFIRNNKENIREIPSSDISKINFIKYSSFNLVKSIKSGALKTFKVINEMNNLFKNLFIQGNVSENLSSPLRLIYDVGNSMSSIASLGNIKNLIGYFLMIIASISLTLGYINLLPIPVLDGGQILFNIINLFARNKLNKKFVNGFNVVGLIIIIILFSLGLSNDIFYFGDI